MASKNTIKIPETFNDFLNLHPELNILVDANGNVLKVLFPPEAKKTSFTNTFGEILLYYEYKGQTVKFPMDFTPF